MEKFSNEQDWGIAKIATQPPADIRLPAEHEPTTAVVMSFKGYTSVLEQLAIEIAKANADVLMINGPQSLGGVPSDQYVTISLPSNSVWARDFGPIGVFYNNGTESAIIDTRYRHYLKRIGDDNVPCGIAKQQGMPCYTTDLILDGGNLMSDGAGNIFMSTRTYDWNSHMPRAQVDALLKSYFGATTFILWSMPRTGSANQLMGPDTLICLPRFWSNALFLWPRQTIHLSVRP